MKQNGKNWKNVRRRAIDRDGGRCFLCGKTGRLDVHHVFPKKLFKELRLDDDNLITLCPKHHSFGRESQHRGMGTVVLFAELKKRRPEQYAKLRYFFRKYLNFDLD